MQISHLIAALAAVPAALAVPALPLERYATVTNATNSLEERNRLIRYDGRRDGVARVCS
jgi:hypothetical protein